MAVTTSTGDTDLVIDLDAPPTGHRLAELLQALTGCTVVQAELVIDDPLPDPIAEADAIDALAHGIVVVTSTHRVPAVQAQA